MEGLELDKALAGPTEAELKAEMDRLEEIGDKKRDELDSNWDYQTKTFDEYQEAIDEIYADYYKAVETHHLVRTPVWDSELTILDRECRMTLEEFMSCINAGLFIDYDGSGVYGSHDKKTDISARPSRMKAGVVRKEFTHVYWYNR